MSKEKVTKQVYQRKVDDLARQVHRGFLQHGTFWPMHLCKKEAEKKLKNQYEIIKP